ncbi:hypothetical protein UACE39S_05786 [Ureibacillus acetophenoni]
MSKLLINPSIFPTIGSVSIKFFKILFPFQYLATSVIILNVCTTKLNELL